MERRPHHRDRLGSLGVLALVGLVLGAVWLVQRYLALPPVGWVLGAGEAFTSSDLQGTLWFYGWVEESLRTGADLLKPPLGCVTPGLFFSNRIDAIVASPLVRHFGLAGGYNHWVGLIPLLNILAAWPLLARLSGGLGAGAARGLFLALPVGFSTYVAWELSGGRPSTGFIAAPLAFLAAFDAALWVKSRPVAFGLAVLAGVLASLVVQSYLPWGVYSGIVAVIISIFRPTRGLWVGTLALGLALVLLGPYLYELAVVRRPAGGLPPEGPWPVWDPQNWRVLIRILGEAAGPAAAQIHGMRSWLSLRELVFVWRQPFQPAVSMGMLTVGLIGGLWSRRAWRWTVSAGVLLVLVLGPTWQWEPHEPGIKPLINLDAWLRYALRVGAAHLRPLRAVPLVHLCLSACLAVFLARRPSAWRWVVALVAVGVDIYLACFSFVDIGRTRWLEPAIFSEMAVDGDTRPIIELPLGMGHATAPFQHLHHKVRMEPLNDVREPTKEACFAQEPLATFARGEPPRDGVSEAHRRALTRFSWVLWYPQAKRPDRAEPAEWGDFLKGTLGEPTYRDELVVAWKVPQPNGP